LLIEDNWYEGTRLTIIKTIGEVQRLKAEVHATFNSSCRPKQSDVRFGHGECGSDADTGTCSEWQISANRGPRRRLAGEALGHERRRLFPEFAMTMRDPRADPDLRTRFDGFAHDLVVYDGFSHEMWDWWIET
jgi:hypothetical protein